jgi:hypothetical protein
LSDRSKKHGRDGAEDTPFYLRWFKYIAAGAFLFFLLKGIGWLVVLGLAVWGFWG